MRLPDSGNGRKGALLKRPDAVLVLEDTGRIRTQIIRSQVLYPLSYGRMPPVRTAG